MDKKYLTITIFYLILIFVLSAQSTLPVPDVFSYQDLLLHAVEYAILFFLLYITFRKTRLWVPFFLAWGYGITDEIHQYFVPGRHMSILDMLADAAGPLLVLFIISMHNKRKSHSGDTA